MISTAQDLIASAKTLPRPVIALSEGTDPRVVAGGLAARAADLADIILVGPRDRVVACLADCGGAEGDGIAIHDPATSDLAESFAAEYHALRQKKGIDLEVARAVVRTDLVYAAMLVRMGHALGTVGGAVATTSDVVRTALQVIGKSPEVPLVSSFFLMFPPEGAADGRAMVYADCGLVIDPSSEDLAAIAAASSRSCAALLDLAPKVGFLSFSTKGSAAHPAVDKVSVAARAFAAAHPEVPADGELQFDAAFLPAVGATKAPGSPVAGQANVMIFPSLDAGNIAYKITQRLGGYSAIGPVLQGLAKPANDLSRGCSANDVTTMIAVTIKQARAG